MAEDLQLPSDLLDEGFFHDFFVERGVSVAAGSKGGDLAGLVRRMGMARSFLQDDGEVAEFVSLKVFELSSCKTGVSFVSAGVESAR